MRLTATWPLLLLVWAIRQGRRSVLLVALATNLLMAATFGAQEAHACSCLSSTPEEQLQRSDAVFSGVVLDVGAVEEPPSSDEPWSDLFLLRLVTFDVEESWKGVSEEPVIVHSPGPGNSCRIDFRQGERYLVYATYGREGQNTSLQTHLCTRTGLLINAGTDLQALGPAEVALPEIVEPATGDPTPVSSTRSDAEAVSSTQGGGETARLVAVSAVLLLLAAVSVFALWRRRPLR